jgi:hypothetical protein
MKNVGHPMLKAPEGWRSPRRFANDGASLKIPTGLGVRWSSTAFRPQSGVCHCRLRIELP